VGGKRTRLPAVPATSDVPVPGTLLERAQAHLDRLLGTVEAGLAQGEVTPALVRESASVARAIATLSAEHRALRRAADEAERLATKGMTVPAVVTFLRRLDPEQRQVVMRELRKMESDGATRSVLG